MLHSTGGTSHNCGAGAVSTYEWFWLTFRETIIELHANCLRQNLTRTIRRSFGCVTFDGRWTETKEHRRADIRYMRQKEVTASCEGRVADNVICQVIESW